MGLSTEAQDEFFPLEQDNCVGISLNPFFSPLYFFFSVKSCFINAYTQAVKH